MDEKTPLVSIGLAVYNGELFLEEAIQSILCQTYSDFELILSDNASTDHTEEICRRYAALDKRIHYYRNAANIGGANNENRTFYLSKGKYFHLHAHDDVLAPDFIEKCLKVIEENPEVVICYTETVFIDQHGDHLNKTINRLGDQKEPYQRFAELIKRYHYCESIYGLIRSEILHKTRLQLNYTNSDRTLLSELCLYGPFYQIAEPLFFKRLHKGNAYIDLRTRMAWFDPGFVGKVSFPYWVQFFDYFVTIGRVPISLSNKLRCYMIMLGPWLVENARYMIKDPIAAAYMLLHSSQWRKKRYESTNNWS